MRRFAITPEAVADGRVVFDASQSRHLARALRLRPGDTIVASDGAGRDYTVRLDAVGARVTGTVVGEAAGAAESPLAVTLVQGVPKGDKMEAIVRAATELGVAAVQPALTARTVVRLGPSAAAERAARWQRVAREAAKLCRRAVVPRVAVPLPLAACLEAARDSDVALCVWEGDAPPLATALRERRLRQAAVLVGPEGGLAESEVEAARSAGWKVVSLGTRVLRTETAGPAVIAILQSRFGDLGGDGGG
ncbi:MAG TPA: 16S rRNA (uracil(1498)-N(3))-methyltransferase [Methylomirabilota bacterium]|jgi:16S rRNA (uracil1498-N3)-methyltransferase